MSKSMLSFFARPLAAFFLIGACANAAHAAKTLTFCGYEWTVKQAPLMGPGPNVWDENNVWLDDEGRMHMKITNRAGKWQCAEVNTKEPLGFGRYQWQIVGRPDELDPQIVLGLFNYTRPEVGPDGTNEIDIEYARWGKAETPIGNFTVWPAVKDVKYNTHPFEFKLDGDYTTHRFDWSPLSINFQQLGGHRDDDANEIAKWNCVPADPVKSIPQQALRLHMNFWLFRGKAPQNGKEAEIIIRNFSFTPRKAE